MKKIRKYLLFTAAALLLLYLADHSGSIKLLPEKLFKLDILGDAAIHTVFSGASYETEEQTTSSDNIFQQAASFVENSLFPGISYAQKEAAQGLNIRDEFYPTQEDLEAFCEENANYEELESEAEARRLESEAAMAEETQSDANPVEEVVATPSNGLIYPRESLVDFNFLMNNFYVVDSSTKASADLIDGAELLDKDLTMDLTGEEPKILIYHTHSQERFADSVPGDINGSVVGLGNTLTQILEEKYGISVYHDTGVYDMVDGIEDRNEAYSLSLAAVEKILAENPSIKVVIDLHRDGVSEHTRLVTTVNGKQTAKIMFFNGICRGADGSENGYLQNPYLTDNLAFSLQMQLKAAEKYPEFTRRIYLRGYRFNMQVAPRALLIECGAQTNTVEEVQNAMEPLADLLYCVLSGK